MKLETFFIVLILATSLGAQDNPNRLQWIDQKGETKELLVSLYNLQGLAPPSASGPFSAEEWAFYTSKLDRTKLTPAQTRALGVVEAEFSPMVDNREGDLFAVDTALSVSLESYLGFGNVTNRVWDRGWGERPDMLDWSNRFWLTQFGFVEFHFDVRQDPIAVLDQRGPWTSNDFLGLDQLDGFFPAKGYLAFGVPHLELKWGHGPLDWGQGESGNLLISNAAGVHDFLEVSTYWDWFKMQLLYMDMDSYTFAKKDSLFLLPGSEDSFLLNPDGSVQLAGLAQTNAFGYLLVADAQKGDSAMDVSRRLVSHRFEMRLPGNVNLHVTEALLFTATTFELRHLMPMFIYHNWFQQWNANPNFTIEAEWTPVPGLTAYGTILGDYVTTSFKDNWYQDPHPLAMGYQLGIRTAHSLDQGILSTVLEGVYIDPYTYLDEAVDWVSMRRVLTNYQNFVSGSYNQKQVMVIDSPLGFFLGPDSALVKARVAYRVPGSWDTYLDVEGQFKGLVTLRSMHPLITNSLAADPTDELPDQDASAKTLFGEKAMKAIIVRLGGSLTPSSLLPALPAGLKLNQSVILKWVKNGMDQFSSRDPLLPVLGNDYFDFQWNLGISYNF